MCYGLGWVTSVYQGEKILWRPGGLIGFCSSTTYLPDRKRGVKGMCDSDKRSGAGGTDVGFNRRNPGQASGQESGQSEHRRAENWEGEDEAARRRRQGAIRPPPDT